MYYIIVRSRVDSASEFYGCRMESEVIARETTILDAQHKLAVLKHREWGKLISDHPNNFIVVRRRLLRKRGIAYNIVPIEEP